MRKNLFWKELWTSCRKNTVLWRLPTPKHWGFKKILATVSFALLSTILTPSLKASSSPGYFQQEVHYRIHVRLNPDLVRLEGRERLVYINHSPDTLKELYFHLYFNKFQAHSYYNPQKTTTLAYTEVRSIRLADGTPLKFSVDNTILHLPLDNSPIAPGDSLTFRINFISVLPPRGSRFGYSGDHYDVGNWYPTPAVYDRFGWHTEQHLRGEFYQEWGSFDVYIQVPREFVVTATGTLLNPEVLPDSVDYPERKVAWYLSEEPDTVTVTYHFFADKVHDFAWSADPEFFRVRRQVDSITVDFFLLPYQQKDWKEAIEAGVEAVRYYQKIIGPYPYQHLSVVGGFITAGGIEYPNLVIINNSIWNPRSVAITVIHEIGHQWFYGLLANNQTRYGWMDEGFTTFIETLCTEHIWGHGDNLAHYRNSFFSRLFGYSRNALQDIRLNYLEYAFSGDEEPINTHFDYFQHNPYIPYYDKTASVLFALKDMLGDSLFLKALQHYYWQWRFRHPYPEDMIRSFEEATGTELNWFFDEWFNTTWRCDYALVGYRGKWLQGEKKNPFQLRIHLRRNEPIAMPVRLQVKLRNGKILHYRIPVAGWLKGNKSKYDLPAWHISNRDYETTIRLPDAVASVAIENATQMLDGNPFNNNDKTLPKIHWYFLRRQYYEPHLDGYTATFFPYLFYNQIDGVQLGWRTTGNFVAAKYQHSFQFLMGTKRLRPSIELEWSSPLTFLSPKLDYFIGYHRGEGLESAFLEIKQQLNRRQRFRSWLIGWQYRHLYDGAYLPYAWSAGRENYLYFRFYKSWYPYRWSTNWGKFAFFAQISLWGSRYYFHKWVLQMAKGIRVFQRWNVDFGFKAGSIVGTPPLQQFFSLAQGSPVDWSRNAFYRAKGILPTSWIRKGHFFVPGGGNIRSALFHRIGEKSFGKHLIAFSFQLELWNPFERFFDFAPILRDIKPVAFTHWAEVWDKKFQLEDIVGEWGLSLKLSSELPLPIRYFSLSGLQLDIPVGYRRIGDKKTHWAFHWSISLTSTKFQ